MSDRRVFLTGATGFVGRHVAPNLIRHGCKLTALVRSRTGSRELETQGVRIVEGHLQDQTALLSGMEGAGAVVHMAAATDVSDPAINRAWNVDGVAQLLEACRSTSVRRLVFFSTHCAGREQRDAYGETKLEGEVLALASGLDVTCLRPTMICGPGSKEFETFLRIIRLFPVVPIIGPGTFELRPSVIGDVAPLVQRCLDRPETIGSTYEIAGVEPISMRDFIGLCARLMGLRRRIFSVPAGLVLPVVRMMGSVMTHTPLSVDQVMAFLQHSVADIEPARRDLDFQPGTLEEGLAWLSRERA